MPATLVVQKFGGSSVADADRIKRVARRIARERAAGHDLVVVVSAMGDTHRRAPRPGRGHHRRAGPARARRPARDRRAPERHAAVDGAPRARRRGHQPDRPAGRDHHRRPLRPGAHRRHRAASRPRRARRRARSSSSRASRARAPRPSRTTRSRPSAGVAATRPPSRSRPASAPAAARSSPTSRASTRPIRAS